MPFDGVQLGRNIERHRRRNGLTQTDLAYALAVTQATVHNWERGVSSPPLNRLYRLADVLGVNVIALLFETDGRRGLDDSKQGNGDEGQAA